MAVAYVPLQEDFPEFPFFKLVIYDVNGLIVAIPEDVISFSFEDLVNGGSGQGTFVVKRAFVDAGWLNYDYRVQFFLNGSVYPWYDGRIIEFDQQQFTSNDEEAITVTTEGWSTQLANAIVSEVLTPSAVSYEALYNGVETQYGGTMNADTYLVHLLGTYIDNTVFGTSYVPSIPLILDGFTFDGQELNSCIDDVVKQVLDNSAQLYEWWVRGTSMAEGGLPAVVIQPQRDPNVFVGPSYFAPGVTTDTQFIVEFKDQTIYEYTIQNASRNLYNMIALYGGQANNVQIYGAFSDAVSISLYGVRQKKVTNSALLTTTSLASYASAYLLQNGYPQPQGSFKKYYASDFARAGQWFQIMERGVTSLSPLAGQPQRADPYRYIDYVSGVISVSTITGKAAPDSARQVTTTTSDLDIETTQNVKQVRAIRVLTTMQEGTNRVEQQVFTTAPRPFIDHAFYGAINYVAGKSAAAQGFAGPTQLYSYFMNNGGNPTPAPAGKPIDNLIVDSTFLKYTKYGSNGRALSPYSTLWSFSLMDGTHYWLALSASEGGLNVQWNGQAGQNCMALSGSFVFAAGAYTLSYAIDTATPGGGTPQWSIVIDKGKGINALAYASAAAVFTLPDTGGASHSVSGTYTSTSATSQTARVLFQSNGIANGMSTGFPKLSYVPAS